MCLGMGARAALIVLRHFVFLSVFFFLVPSLSTEGVGTFQVIG